MVVHVNERLHALLLSYYFYSIYKHILRHDGGALGEQDWACSLIENDMIVRIHIQIKKGAFLIEAKQLFFCEVNFVYMFTNGTIFLHANDW